MSEQFVNEFRTAIFIGLGVWAVCFALGFYALIFRGVSLVASVERAGGGVAAVVVIGMGYGAAAFVFAIFAQIASNYVWVYFTTAAFPDRNIGIDIFGTAEMTTPYLGLNSVLNFVLATPTIFPAAAAAAWAAMITSEMSQSDL